MKNFFKKITLIIIISFIILSCNDDNIEKQFLCCDETSNIFNTSKVITPNGDGNNDFFLIYNIEQYPNSKVSIYDLNNILVYDNYYDNSFYTFIGENQFTGEELKSNSYKYKIDTGTGDDPEYGYLCLIRKNSDLDGFDFSDCGVNDPIL